jgi:hypothetical protein
LKSGTVTRAASVLGDRAQSECARSMRAVEATRLTVPLVCIKMIKESEMGLGQGLCSADARSGPTLTHPAS